MIYTMRRLILPAILLSLGLGSARADDPTLVVGDPAPSLAVGGYVKGEKVERLEPDRTYVVEFWATWCGPCIQTIPHLTKLQKKFNDKGVKFIGVSVFERGAGKVEPFVKEMGDKMDYSVAFDDVPKGEKGDHGKMALAWMKASESDGIPTAFVVRNGKVAWIGHPMELEPALESTLKPDFDLAKAASLAREERARQQKLVAVFQKINKLGDDATDKQRLAVIDAAIADDPALEAALGYPKYLMMFQSRDEAAAAYGNKLVDKFLADDPQRLNDLAWANVGPEAKENKLLVDVKLALKAATRANELAKGENGAILDTLAKATFDNGDPKKALEIQEKAVKLMADAADLEEMKQRLETYRKAAK